MRRRGRRPLKESDTCAELGTTPFTHVPVTLPLGWPLLAGMVTAATAAQAQLLAVSVIRVVGGDTMVVSTAESINLKVRLQGIDAPECGMPFGPQAQRFL
jgi:endonuclease YncB( thermonuclease family)